MFAATAVLPLSRPPLGHSQAESRQPGRGKMNSFLTKLSRSIPHREAPQEYAGQTHAAAERQSAASQKPFLVRINKRREGRSRVPEKKPLVFLVFLVFLFFAFLVFFGFFLLAGLIQTCEK